MIAGRVRDGQEVVGQDAPVSTGPPLTPGGSAPVDPPGGVEVHRSELGRVCALAWLVLAMLLAIDVVHRGHGRSAALSLVVLGLLSLGVYALAWRPELVIDEQAVTLVNPLRTVRVPWRAVSSVGGRWSLEIRTQGGTYAAWASGPRPRRRRRPLCYASDAPELPDESRVSRRVTARWEDVVSRPVAGTAEPVGLHWDGPLLLTGSLLLAILAALVVTG